MKIITVRQLTYVLVFLLFCFAARLNGQTLDLRFNHLSSENGLSENVNAYVYQDSTGYIWLSSSNGLNRYNGNEVAIYKLRSDTSAAVVDDRIISRFLEDQNHNIWFTSVGGLHCYDRKNDNVKTYPLLDPASGDTLSGDIYAFHIDNRGRIWLQAPFQQKSFLYHFDITNQNFEKIHPLGGQRFEVIEDEEGNVERLIVTMFFQAGGLEIFHYSEGEMTRDSFLRPDRSLDQKVRVWKSLATGNRQIWLATNKGLGLFDPVKDTCYYFDQYQGKKIGTVWSVAKHPDRDLIFASTRGNGLLLFDFEGEKNTFVQQFRQVIGDPGSLRSDNLYDLYIDRQKNLWVSIWGQGVDFANLEKIKFSTYLLDQSHPEGQTEINSIEADQEGNIWIATEGKGILVMHPKTKEILRHWTTISGNTGGDRVTRIFHDDQQLGMLGLVGRQLYQYVPDSRSFRLLAETPEPNLTDICRVGNRLLLSSYKGIWELVQSQDGYRLIPCPDTRVDAGEFISGLFLDQEMRLYTPRKTVNVRYYRQEPGSDRLLPGGLIDETGYAHQFLESEKGRIWTATSQGLLEIRFQEGRDTPVIRQIDDTRGLPADYFLSLAPGADGQLWLGGRSGMYCFQPRDSSHHRYSVADGLQGMRFIRRAVFRNENGELWFGGKNGLNIFDPSEVRDIDLQPTVVLTRLLVNNKDLSEIGMTGIPDQISLKHDQNNLTFHFSALDFSSPGANHYEYRLLRYDDQWVSALNSTFAHLSKLPPGNYTFQVRATNSDGIWNENNPASIRIRVKYPPFWSPAAWGIYILIAVASIYRLILFYRKRRREKEENRRLQEMDELKSRFFANITHEFRTPLTLILGPINKALRKKEVPKQEDLKMVQRQGRRLSHLISQILDLNKLEAGNLPVRYLQSDLIPYIRHLFASFDILAENKNIRYRLECDTDSFLMDFDPAKLNHIFLNLISNALKFTDEGGEVVLTVKTGNEGMVDFIVQDSGIGIPADQIGRIFDRFHQVDNSLTREKEGTGIGLALTKELTELMKGSIYVDSRTGEGTAFTVSLPVTRNAEIVEPFDLDAEVLELILAGAVKVADADDEPEEERINRDIPKNAPMVLIVEDNPDMAKYVGSCLQGDYELHFAEDGEVGVEKALELIPDLIISDIMMPRKSGLSLTEELKTNKSTSHIPIVLLTAKSDDEDRVAGLKRGADAHLGKPFNQEELSLRLKQLMDQRAKLQRYFQEQTGVGMNWEAPGEAVVVENEFVQEVSHIIEEECHRFDFTIDELAGRLFMSEATLRRKFDAVLGMTPKKFVNEIRMKRAKEKLIHNDLSIGQIALDCGFNENAAFTRAFKKAAGLTPTEFREKYQPKSEGQ